MRHLVLGAAAVACGLVVWLFGPETEARILLTVMTILAWSFALLYGLRSPWRSTEAGKTLMYTAVGIGLIGLQLISVWWLGDYSGRAEVRSLVVTVLVLALLHRLIVLWRFQHEESDREVPR